jgi:thioredoxin 1
MAESKNVFEATDASFESEVLQTKGITLVDFWAEWCGPCKMLGPTLAELADEQEGKIKIYKMNVDENQQTPGKFQVRGIPTVIVLKDGQLVDQLVGNHPKSAFEEIIAKHS